MVGPGDGELGHLAQKLQSVEQLGGDICSVECAIEDVRKLHILTQNNLIQIPKPPKYVTEIVVLQLIERLVVEHDIFIDNACRLAELFAVDSQDGVVVEVALRCKLKYITSIFIFWYRCMSVLSSPNIYMILPALVLSSLLSTLKSSFWWWSSKSIFN